MMCILLSNRWREKVEFIDHRNEALDREVVTEFRDKAKQDSSEVHGKETDLHKCWQQESGIKYPGEDWPPSYNNLQCCGGARRCKPLQRGST